VNGFGDDSPDLKIGTMVNLDWPVCRILRQQGDTSFGTVESLYRQIAIDHCDDNAAIGRVHGPVYDQQIAGTPLP
jgi:hypothetical protein